MISAQNSGHDKPLSDTAFGLTATEDTEDFSNDSKYFCSSPSFATYTPKKSKGQGCVSEEQPHLQ